MRRNGACCVKLRAVQFRFKYSDRCGNSKVREEVREVRELGPKQSLVKARLGQQKAGETQNGRMGRRRGGNWLTGLWQTTKGASSLARGMSAWYEAGWINTNVGMTAGKGSETEQL